MTLWNGLELPESYFRDDNVYIIHGDSKDILPAMPNSCVDALVCDPPFGIGFSYNGKREEHNKPDEYWDWFSPIYTTVLTKLKPGALIAVWQAQLYYPYFWKWFGNNIHIYIGAKNFVQLRKTSIQYGYDPIIMSYYGRGTPLRPSKPKRNIDFFVSNTAKWVTQTKDMARLHPCPRPIDQVETLIDNFTLPNGIVIDPFLGSGTTAICAIKSGRKCIGIELSEEYCELSAIRYLKSRAEAT